MPFHYILMGAWCVVNGKNCQSSGKCSKNVSYSYLLSAMSMSCVLECSPLELDPYWWVKINDGVQQKHYHRILGFKIQCDLFLSILHFLNSAQTEISPSKMSHQPKDGEMLFIIALLNDIL